MTDIPRRRALSRTLILLAALTAAPILSHAQNGSATPPHARANASGTGWECDRGYQRINGACATVELPANAYLTKLSFGRGWDCMRGHRAVNDSCVAVEVPEHGYLDSSGDRWKCERGYRNVAERCAPIVVPQHAYLESGGDRWACGRAYR